MAQEPDQAIAYLKALKQPASSPTAAAAAPARETSLEAQTGSSDVAASPGAERFTGAEKRRSPRYKCEGSVEMREGSCDVRTWATFTDISLHGCYVEAQATYPVGAQLQMKLEANGLRVETKGTVRVNYPYLGMGIAFQDLSEENRTRLKELLGTISRPAMIMGPGIASALPAGERLSALPLISNPEAALQALASFFEDRQMLMRDDFLRILRQSQATDSKR